METRANYFIVGLFTLFGLFGIAGGLLWLAPIDMSQNETPQNEFLRLVWETCC